MFIQADQDVTVLNWIGYLAVAPTTIAAMLATTFAKGFYIAHRLPFVMIVRLACVLGIVPLPFLSASPV